jgi:hypothetical protein
MEHTAEWKIRLYLYEHDEDTTVARVVLDTGSNVLHGEGMARRNPIDPSVPEIGDELAAGRALEDLAGQLKGAASTDIAALGGRD